MFFESKNEKNLMFLFKGFLDLRLRYKIGINEIVL